MAQAYFISFEGIDGSGKTTMMKRMEAHLAAKGMAVTTTFEPGGCTLGRYLRDMLLNVDGPAPNARAEALLFAAERAAHVEEVIRPALLADEIVLCNRFSDSTLAYQGGGRGLSMQFLNEISLFASGGVMPDLSFVLDLPLEIARTRQTKQKDRLEQEDAAFYKRVITAYHKLAEREPDRVRLVDASQQPDQVFAALQAFLPPHLR